jgi:hypothetical protein
MKNSITLILYLLTIIGNPRGEVGERAGVQAQQIAHFPHWRSYQRKNGS